jgi:hypothetical protein
MSTDGNKTSADVQKSEKKFLFPIDIRARGRLTSLNHHFKALELLGEGEKIGSTTVKHNRL